MTSSQDSQLFDSYVPVYDTVPETWEDARPFLVEELKLLANAVNVREIGWFLDEELLSGKQFFPSAINKTGTQGQFRSVLRKVVDVSPLINGVNPGKPHGIVFDDNFRLIDMWVAATNTMTKQAINLTDRDVTLDAVNININSNGVYDIAYATIEYIQEV